MIKSVPFKTYDEAKKFANRFPEDNFCIEKQQSGAWCVSVLLDDHGEEEKFEYVKNGK